MPTLQDIYDQNNALTDFISNWDSAREINDFDHNNCNALIYAIASHQVDIVNALIEHGATLPKGEFRYNNVTYSSVEQLLESGYGHEQIKPVVIGLVKIHNLIDAIDTLVEQQQAYKNSKTPFYSAAKLFVKSLFDPSYASVEKQAIHHTISELKQLKQALIDCDYPEELANEVVYNNLSMDSIFALLDKHSHQSAATDGRSALNSMACTVLHQKIVSILNDGEKKQEQSDRKRSLR